MQLIPLSDYIKQIEGQIIKDGKYKDEKGWAFDKIITYTNFLRMPLTIDLFQSHKYFKDIEIQDNDMWQSFYHGIRVFHWNKNEGLLKQFSEIFDNAGKPRIYDTIEDLIKFKLEMQDNLEF